MAGVLSSDYGSGSSDWNSFGIEPTGIYSGILQEDMIDTVRRVRKPYIDVLLTDHFKEDSNYPLTYVPFGFNTLPLRKDQQVLVKFNQDNPRYPILYKIPQAYGEDGPFLKDFELPESTDNIEFPSSKKTSDVIFVNENFQFIATKDYELFRRGDNIVLFEGDKITVNFPTIQALGDEVKIESKNTIIDTTSGKLIIQNTNGGSLGDILHDLLDKLATTSPTTMGSPGSQSFNPTIVTAIQNAQQLSDALLKG